MKFSYKLSTVLFFVLYLAPLAAVGFLVQYRIQERQITLQRYLQNQVDVDRQIIAHRAPLRNIHAPIHSFFLRGGSAEEGRRLLEFLREEQEKQEIFWKRYENAYAVGYRPFLREILEESQELNLIEEEARAVLEIQRAIDRYFTDMSSHPGLDKGNSLQNNELFFDRLDEEEAAIFQWINELADIRYIFAQRIVFSVGGENDRQTGFFNTIFTALSGILLIAMILEHFYIHRPFGDLMLFLKDMSQGKRGQRLYFSSPIREIKESEEIINEFVSKSEEHEKEKNG